MKWTRTFAATLLVLSTAAPAYAANVLLDRGLPTANLNDGAGASRSNVNWYGDSTGYPATYELLGDTVTNTSSQTWAISTLRMWTVEPFTAGSAQLYGGIAGGGAYTAISTGATVTAGLQYQGGINYTDFWGADTSLWQIDFAVNIFLGAGETLEYLFDADVIGYDGPPGLHASNRVFSGSPQEGSDDLMLFGQLTGGNAVRLGTWTSNVPGEWDKASDFNIQVIGEVPEPGSLALAGLALFGLAAARRRTA